MFLHNRSRNEQWCIGNYLRARSSKQLQVPFVKSWIDFEVVSLRIQLFLTPINIIYWRVDIPSVQFPNSQGPISRNSADIEVKEDTIRNVDWETRNVAKNDGFCLLICELAIPIDSPVEVLQNQWVNEGALVQCTPLTVILSSCHKIK